MFGPLSHNPLVGGSNPSGPIDLRRIASGCAARVAAVGAESASIAPDLEAIIDAWPALPAVVKAGIVAMVRAAGGTTGQER